MLSQFHLEQRAEGEEKTLAGDVKTSPPRSAPKKQLPSIPKNALPIAKPTSPAPAAQSTNGTHASYGPFYLEYSLLAELWVLHRWLVSYEWCPWRLRMKPCLLIDWWTNRTAQTCSQVAPRWRTVRNAGLHTIDQEPGGLVSGFPSGRHFTGRAF